MPEVNLDTIAQTIEAQGKAFEALKQENEKRLKQIEEKGSVDPLTKTAIDRINTYLDGVDEKKEKVITAKAMGERIDSLETAVARTQKGLGAGDEKVIAAEVKAYTDALFSYLRKGTEAPNFEELQRKAMEVSGMKALSVGSDPDGGYTVTPQMSATIIKNVFESSPIRQLASVETISTDSLEFLDDHDEATVGWTGETTAITETATPTLAKRNIPVHELFAEPRATQKLLDDSSFNIEQWLSQKVSDKFARTEATAFVSGDGVGKPRGFLTYAAGTTWGTIEQVVSGSAGAVAADGLIKLLYSLKEEYARNAAFLMNRTTVRDVRLLKESTTNQYIWQPGLKQNNFVDTLLGAPLYMATDMPVAASNSLSIALADWRRAYQIVDRIGIRVLRDPLTAKPFVKFYTTKRVGGDVLNFEAIKLQKLST